MANRFQLMYPEAGSCYRKLEGLHDARHGRFQLALATGSVLVGGSATHVLCDRSSPVITAAIRGWNGRLVKPSLYSRLTCF